MSLVHPETAVRFNYQMVAKELRLGRVVPFFGSGASCYTMGDLNETGSCNDVVPPSAQALAEALALECLFPDDDPSLRADLAWVATWYENSEDRPTLCNRLVETLAASNHPNALHRFFARVAAQTPFLAVTTNYDDLFEKALDSQGCAYDVVVSATDRDDMPGCFMHRQSGSLEFAFLEPDKLRYISPKVKTVLFKVHGSINRLAPEKSSFIISEEDYITFLTKMSTSDVNVVPDFLTPSLRGNFLFMGYGLRDWNFRVLLRRLSAAAGRRDKRRHWAIMKSCRPAHQKFWEWQNIRAHSIDLHEFQRELEATWLAQEI